MITIPGYTVLRQVHNGKRTSVYQALRISDNQPVAIKTCRPEYLTAQTVELLRREHEITGNINLNGVVRSLAYENYDGGMALIVEDFGGLPLKNLISPAGVPLELFLDVAIQAAAILSELHQRQIIHKNVNPSNIIFNPATRQLKLTNFSKAFSQEKENGALSPSSLAYLSPERTGRINRPVDYRTDFYSLGVTLYHLLTGNLPFSSNDMLGLIHSHIAREPEEPARINKGIPAVLSDIIMKLLGKNAEDRYQSGSGLKTDLVNCLDQLKKHDRIEPFALGTRDIPHRFVIQHKLYGREQELEQILSGFDRVCQGAIELLFVSGNPGIGKTTLVNEIHKPILAQNGYFISGKYDQLKKNVPYSAIILAFKSLIKQLLSEHEELLLQWKEQLRNALGVNGRIIIDVIPEVELIIGKQPPLSPAGPTETANRFNRVMQRFVEIFAGKEHPLVLFLDDLQWIDQASVHLLMTLVTDPRIKHLFLIGAYRDNEVTTNHLLQSFLDESTRNGLTVKSIKLSPLSVEQLNNLVKDTLTCSSERAEPLARVVHEKTGGNPFFVNQVLKIFHEEKILLYEATRGWRWKVEEIDRLDVTDNVVDLLVGKIAKLSPETQEVLKLASCIGNRFDLENLTIVYEKSPDRTFGDLHQALQEGLVIAADENYLFFHDRIQEAAYSLIPVEEKKKIHYRIGNLVFKKSGKDTLLAKVFYIADQLNAGSELIIDQAERYELAKLNLLAGKKAKSSTAYASAEKYLTNGIELLEEDSWPKQYALTFELFQECSECKYLSGSFEKAEELFDVLLHKAKTNREKAEIYKIMVALAQNRGNSREALEYGRTGLYLLGHKVPPEPGSITLFLEILRIKWHIGRRTVDDLLLIPPMDDPDRQTMAEILINMAPAAYFTNKELFCLVLLHVFTLSLRHGQTNMAPLGFSTYGFIQSVLLGDYRQGYRFCDTACS